jgi:hypothetical protein
MRMKYNPGFIAAGDGLKVKKYIPNAEISIGRTNIIERTIGIRE